MQLPLLIKMAAGGEFNPSIKDAIPNAYRPWYVVVTLLSILTGAALIAMGIVMKVMDDDLSWLVCHIWTGIPLFVGGFVAIVPCASKSRKVAIFYLIFMFACMVVCATGAIINGLEYWTSFWQQTRLSMDDDKCSVVKGSCICKSIPDDLLLPLPVSVAVCSDLKVLVRLMIATIAIDVLGFIVSTIAVFLAFMSVCCAPWVYLKSYSRGQDPDFTSVVPVRHTGTINKGYN